MTAFLQQATGQDTAILSAEMTEMGADFHVRVVLDSLAHPLGAVSVQELEQFSRRAAQLIDEAETPPFGLTPDNYSLEAQSAGAERELRLPEDLQRFRASPMRVRFRAGGERYNEVLKYVGNDEQTGSHRFEQYTQRRKKNRTANKRAQALWQTGSVLGLQLEDIESVNLYLDF